MALASVSSSQKIALITGSNKGIGYEIARKIGSVKQGDDGENAFVCILGCRNELLGQKAMEKLKAEGMSVDFCKIDLEDKDSITSAAAYIQKTYGGKCDVLVNNAAVCFNDPTLYGKVKHTPFDEQAEITIRTNFFGTLALTEAMLPLLEKSESGRIINIASSAGRLSILPSQERRDAFSSETLELKELQGFMKDFVKAAKDGTHKEQGWPNTGYGVSKVGIIAMSKIFARKYPKMMINTVDPGYCQTDQNDNQGFVPPERGATTPFLLATIDQHFSGVHWYEEQAIVW
ncbi:unnamed protein product [Cylindrotheca closterium]|uniref:Protochlorophyllide reductase n=1 Tax=Cylindrotheca closterium TaxID=2856 RepID=A0AAD2GCF0_9STRA|nr:unnamed protein product [Cylindrotheca closterium]